MEAENGTGMNTVSQDVHPLSVTRALSGKLGPLKVSGESPYLGTVASLLGNRPAG